MQQRLPAAGRVVCRLYGCLYPASARTLASKSRERLFVGIFPDSKLANFCCPPPIDRYSTDFYLPWLTRTHYYFTLSSNCNIHHKTCRVHCAALVRGDGVHWAFWNQCMQGA